MFIYGIMFRDYYNLRPCSFLSYFYCFTILFKVIVKDRESNSELLTIKIYILEHKCESGVCVGPDTDKDCQGTDRADGKIVEAIL